MCLHSLYTWHLQVLSRIQLERLQCFPRLPSWYNSRPTIVCRPCLSFASNSKSLLIELTGVLNINSFPSHTTFLQLTNLSISTTWFLFNTVTTSVLHLQSLFIYSLSCLSTSPFFEDHRSFFTIVLWNELFVELYELCQIQSLSISPPITRGSLSSLLSPHLFSLRLPL